jgi:hypothetical protein
VIKISNKEQTNAVKEGMKVLVLLLLSYVVPIIGIGFSIYILSNTKLRNYGQWVFVLSMISLIIHLIVIVLALLGYFMFIAAQ